MHRKRLTEELEDLRNGLEEMSSLVCRDIHDAVKALKERDEELADSVKEGDERINEMYSRLKELCIEGLALQQPVAKDLRLLGIAIDVLYNLERIADYADDIGVVAKHVKDYPVDDEVKQRIEEMGTIAVRITEKAAQSFIDLDTSKREEIWEDEKRMNDLFKSMFPLLRDIVVEKGEKSIYAMNMMLVSKYLERIADHAINIENRTHYAVKGKSKYL